MRVLVCRELERECFTNRLELLRAGRSDDDSGDLGYAEQPGESESRHRHAAPERFALEGLERIEDGVVFELAVAIGTLRHPRAFRVSVAAPIASGKPAAGDRAVYLVPEAVLAADGKHVVGVVPLEELERVLYPLVACQPFELGDLDRKSVV